LAPEMLQGQPKLPCRLSLVTTAFGDATGPTQPASWPFVCGDPYLRRYHRGFSNSHRDFSLSNTCWSSVQNNDVWLFSMPSPKHLPDILLQRSFFVLCDQEMPRKIVMLCRVNLIPHIWTLGIEFMYLHSDNLFIPTLLLP